MISASQDGQSNHSRVDPIWSASFAAMAGSDERPAPRTGFSRSYSVAEIVQPHREPTPPAVIPRCFGKGQGLRTLRADCASDWFRYDALPHSCSFLGSLSDTRYAADGLCQARPARPPARSRALYTLVFHLPIGQSLGPSAGQDDGTGL